MKHSRHLTRTISALAAATIGVTACGSASTPSGPKCRSRTMPDPKASPPLGLTELGSLMLGPEILALVGGGASGKNLGIFGVDADDCLFRFTIFSGNPLGIYIGATVSFLDTFGCLPNPNVFGTAGFWTSTYENEGADGWFGSSAAFRETSPGDFTYIPASDDFSEGLSLDDLPNNMFDCSGVTHP